MWTAHTRDHDRPRHYDYRVAEMAADTGMVTLRVVADPRPDLFLQIPVVVVHESVRAALGVPDFTLVVVRCGSARRRVSAWLIGNDDPSWYAIRTPWHRTVQFSVALWRDLSVRPSRVECEMTVARPRMTVRPARLGSLLDSDEVGIHADDADRLGLDGWAVINHCGMPGAYRVRRSEDDRDAGILRLTYQSRMLQAIPSPRNGLRPDTTVSAVPHDRAGRVLLVGSLLADGHKHSRLTTVGQRIAGAIEKTLRIVLRAPAVSFRTVEATPGEDQSMIARIRPELFPLLGIQAGDQVYVEWGPRNRSVVIALEQRPPDTAWPDIEFVGHRPEPPPSLPDFAVIGLGATTRVALGIPRMAVVTVRRRVTPLIVKKANQLIVPVAGLFLGLSVDAHLAVWLLVCAAVVILGLMIAPIRMRRPPRGRVR